MPLVLLHKEVYQKVHDNNWLASLALECVEGMKNPDMLCGLIAVLIEHRAFEECFDTNKISNRSSLAFFQEQYNRATLAVA